MPHDKPDVANGGHPAVAPTALLLAEIERLKAELIQAEWKIAELEERADVDSLLDVLNRRGFDRELARALAYVKRYGTAAALIFIDLDNFKAINDLHGHAAGDALLKAVAATIKTHVRASDMVARFGGDEFVVLLWNLDATQASVKARALEDVIAATVVAHGAARITVGASAGSVLLDGDATPAATIEVADQAMYARKKERRG